MLLDKVKQFAQSSGNLSAVISGNCSLSYRQLWDFSDKLAFYIQKNLKHDKSPLIVYGHKNPFMIVCFLACVKSGRAYCPVDMYIPKERFESIVNKINPPMIFSIEDVKIENKNVLSLSEIKDIIINTNDKIDSIHCVKENDIFYIIFTSGSTGEPKGIQITYSCLNNFLKWSSTLGDLNFKNDHFNFINQASLSFDLSVMDLYTSLYTGSTLWCLDKTVQSNYNLLFDSLKKSNVNVWVSTPSFVDMCLISDEFNYNLLNNIKTFIFCGETLQNNVAKKLMRRFPNSKVINTYGPTESTVAISSIEISNEIVDKYDPLPIGKAKPGTFVFIQDKIGNNLPENNKGEIVIVGDTVSTGYFKDKERTDKSFGTKLINNIPYRSYKTGDEGYIKDDLLFYSGRIDFQIKLHGYRIELGDIENNLMKIKNVENAVVIPIKKDNVITDLASYIVFKDKIDKENKLSTSISIKKELEKLLPKYMIPKKIIFIDKMPMTNNSKIDRKKLSEALNDF